LNRPLAVIQPEIDRCFEQRSVGEITTVLMARREQGFQDFLRQMQRGAPLALDATFQHLSTAADRSLEEVLIESYRINRRLMSQGDPKEGIRALLIDKDGRPAWQPAPAETRKSQIATLFSPLSAEPELYFDAA
jgi:enoyl-CoA hydratase